VSVLPAVIHAIRRWDIPVGRFEAFQASMAMDGILDEIEKAGYQVLDRRVAVSTPRRLAVAGGALLRVQGRRLAMWQR
jgi:phytoene synthase